MNPNLGKLKPCELALYPLLCFNHTPDIFMFNPSLTIELGIERIGDIVDGSQIEVPPNDPIFQHIRKSNLAVKTLLDEDAIVDFGGVFGGIHLVKDSYRQIFNEAFPPEDYDAQIFKRAPTRFSNPSGNADLAVREAIINALEHGAGKGIAVRKLVGTKGELFVIAQGEAGPALEPVLERYNRGQLTNYFVGKHTRGNGMRQYSKSRAQVWYTQLESGYALLILDDSNGEVYDLEFVPPPPNPSLWQPEPGTPDARLWTALVNCDAELQDPREFYRGLFEDLGWTLDEALQNLDPRVRKLFDINVRGFLGEED